MLPTNDLARCLTRTLAQPLLPTGLVGCDPKRVPLGAIEPVPLLRARIEVSRRPGQLPERPLPGRDRRAGR